MLDTYIVLDGRAGPAAAPNVDRFIASGGIAIEPVTAEQARVARDAYRRFGKGHHSAGLNFGDCFAYALARVTCEPLLFKGGDFALTDLQAA